MLVVSIARQLLVFILIAGTGYYAYYKSHVEPVQTGNLCAAKRDSEVKSNANGNPVVCQDGVGWKQAK